jgi:DNA adenine methylase
MIRYPGGKRKIKGLIASSVFNELKKLNFKAEYREPFFGGGSIGLFVCENSKVDFVWLNDSDEALYCLWKAALDSPEELSLLVEKFVPSVEDFYKIKEHLLQNKGYGNKFCKRDIDLGFMKLVIHQISYSGLGPKSGGPLGGRDQKSKYNISCRWSPEHIKKTIYKAHHLLRFKKRLGEGNILSSLDFIDLIEHPGDAVFYLDPPYYIKGEELYQFSFSEEDHVRLRDALKKTKQPWILSYDDCEEIKKLYSGFSQVKEVNITYSIQGARKKSELLIASKTIDI